LGYLPLLAVSRSALRLLFRLRREGELLLPPNQGVIVAANHASFLDVPALVAALPLPLRFMATAKFAPNPLYRAMISLSGSFFVPLSGKSPEAFRKALTYLARGEAVAIYPEGARSPDGSLLPGKPGLVRIALAAGVPILPCAIVGTHRAWPMGQLFPRPHPVVVRIGEPLDFSSWRDKAGDRAVLTELTARVMAAIGELLTRPPGCDNGGRSISS
jgi:1-acyl-sn-glycerol-3-phosphate acyltransferase